MHRLALARVDLVQVLARTGQVSEATSLGLQAIGSWRIVRSDLYDVTDLDRILTKRYPDATEVAEFHSAYLDATNLLTEQHRALTAPDDEAE